MRFSSVALNGTIFFPLFAFILPFSHFVFSRHYGQLMGLFVLHKKPSERVRSFRYSTYFIQRLLILFHIIFFFGFFVYRTIMHISAYLSFRCCCCCFIFALILMLIECRAHAIISVHLLYFEAKANDFRLID